MMGAILKRRRIAIHATPQHGRSRMQPRQAGRIDKPCLPDERQVVP